MLKKSLICSVVFHLLLCAGLELTLELPVHLAVGPQGSDLIMVAFDTDASLPTGFSQKNTASNGPHAGQSKNLIPADKSVLEDRLEQSTELRVAEETPPPLLSDDQQHNNKIAMTGPGESGVGTDGTQTSGLQSSEQMEEETFPGVSSLSPETRLPERLPVKVRHSPPKYPLIARHNNWEGVTVLEIQIRPDGTVGEVEVSQSSGYQVLDQAVKKAVKHWRYRPALKNGVAVACQIRVRIKFVLE